MEICRKYVTEGHSRTIGTILETYLKIEESIIVPLYKRGDTKEGNQ